MLLYMIRVLLLQAIHARSMVPCQDTPGIKVPYTAKVDNSESNLTNMYITYLKISLYYLRCTSSNSTFYEFLNL